MTADDLGEAGNFESALRVAGLHYRIAWQQSSRWRWAPDVFPVDVHVRGWTLQVTQHRIVAQPDGTKFSNEGSARENLEPQLEAWVAELAVVYNLPLKCWFQGAEVVPDVGASFSGRGEVTLGDRADAVDAIQVEVIRGELPGPTWTERPSSLARDAREYCLLPMRGQRRNEADVTWWLYEAIKKSWAGKTQVAAATLNLDHEVLQEMRRLSANAYDRKVGPKSRKLTAEQKQQLQRLVELVVLRLHLHEMGEPVGDHVTIDQI